MSMNTVRLQKQADRNVYRVMQQREVATRSMHSHTNYMWLVPLALQRKISQSRNSARAMLWQPSATSRWLDPQQNPQRTTVGESPELTIQYVQVKCKVEWNLQIYCS